MGTSSAWRPHEIAQRAGQSHAGAAAAAALSGPWRGGGRNARLLGRGKGEQRRRAQPTLPLACGHQEEAGCGQGWGQAHPVLEPHLQDPRAGHQGPRGRAAGAAGGRGAGAVRGYAKERCQDAPTQEAC